MVVDHPRLDLLEDDLGAGDGQVERLAAVALDGEGDVGARLAADLRDLVVDGRALDALAVDGEHVVAGLQPGPVGRRVVERCDDDEAADVVERGAGGQVGRILRVRHRHLGTDAAEAAGQVTERLLVLLGRHVARVRVLDAVLEHAADRALGQLVGVEIVDVVVLDPVVRLAERGERLVGCGAAGGRGAASGQVAADEEDGTDHGGQREGDDPGHRPRAGGPLRGRSGVQIGHV